MLGHRALKPHEYVAIFKRRWWQVLVPVAVLSAAGFGMSYLVAPRFISQTLVLIEQQKVPDDYVKPVISSDLDSRLASMKEQILSRSRIQPVIERFGLYPGRMMDERLDEARRNIDIKPIRSEISHANGLPGFFISFRAGDARTAQQVCGEITSLFVGANLRAREQSAQGTTDFLEAQLAEAKNNLDAQDKKLAEFQRKYLGRLPGEQAPNLNMLTSLSTQLQANTQQLARMEQDRAYQESLLAQQNQQASAKPAAVPNERQKEADDLQQQLDTLSARYTQDYPDVVSTRRKLDDLKREIRNAPVAAASTSRAPDSVGVQQLRASIRASEQGIAAKRLEQQQLESATRSYQARIEGTPLVEEEYKALTRDYQTAQQFYDDLLAKMNQSKMATNLERRQQGEQFRVMDEPNLPESPAYPKRSLFVLGGMALGLLVGLGITGLLEYADTAIRSEEDIHAFLKLHTLGVINLAEDSEAMEDEPLRKRLRRRMARSPKPIIETDRV